MIWNYFFFIGLEIKLMISFINQFRVITIPRVNNEDDSGYSAIHNKKELEAMTGDSGPLEEIENSKLADSNDVRRVLSIHSKFSDFVLLCQLGDNMDANMFSEFVHYFSDFLQKAHSSNRSSSFNDSGVQESEFDGHKRPDDDDGGQYPVLTDNMAYA